MGRKGRQCRLVLSLGFCCWLWLTGNQVFASDEYIAGYASAMGSAIASSGQHVTSSTQATLQLSYASAADLASQNPKYSEQILAAAKSSFLQGDQWAYIAGLAAVLLGMALVFFLFPGKEKEHALHAEFAAEDEAQPSV